MIQPLAVGYVGRTVLPKACLGESEIVGGEMGAFHRRGSLLLEPLQRADQIVGVDEPPTDATVLAHGPVQDRGDATKADLRKRGLGGVVAELGRRVLA
jgi:hypothetical protein